MGWRDGEVRGTSPGLLRREFDDPPGQQAQAAGIGEVGGQSDLDPGCGFLDATLIKLHRMMSNWALRQNEVLGASPRRLWSSQYAAVWIRRRNWLAVALVHEVRSAARWRL